jgi:hypothetical protein
MKKTVVHHSADFDGWKVIGGPRVNHLTQRSEWLCRCKCGTERWVRDNGLKNGSTNCGCRRKENLAARNRKRTGGVWVDHKRSAFAWDRMIRRCNDHEYNGYQNYGGRGIMVCQRWSGEGGLKNFVTDMGDPPPGFSLGRIQNNEGYFPGNCRWETNEQQQSNKRTNVYGYFNGNRMTAAQIGRMVGKSGSSIARLIKKGFYANDRCLS